MRNIQREEKGNWGKKKQLLYMELWRHQDPNTGNKMIHAQANLNIEHIIGTKCTEASSSFLL